MRTVKVDEEVYQELGKKSQGFDDTPNSVLRRILGLPEPGASDHEPRGRRTGRSKAPRATLNELVRKGYLSEGQVLFMHDYQGKKLEGVTAKISGNNLEYGDRVLSMSALVREIMQKRGHKNDSYRGPQFWYTFEGKSVKDIWQEYLREQV